jgi:hypothetical protein
MFHLIVHLYIRPGMETAFREYETEALGLFRAYGGTLIAAFKPERLPASDGGAPDEIHVLSMPSRERFEAWRSSPEVTAMSGRRAQVLLKTELFLAREPVAY